MRFTPQEIRLLIYIALMYVVIVFLHLVNLDRAIAPVGFPMLLVALIGFFRMPWKLAERIPAARRIQ